MWPGEQPSVGAFPSLPPGFRLNPPSQAAPVFPSLPPDFRPRRSPPLQSSSPAFPSWPPPSQPDLPQPAASTSSFPDWPAAPTLSARVPSTSVFPSAPVLPSAPLFPPPPVFPSVPAFQAPYTSPSVPAFPPAPAAFTPQSPVAGPSNFPSWPPRPAAPPAMSPSTGSDTAALSGEASDSSSRSGSGGRSGARSRGSHARRRRRRREPSPTFEDADPESSLFQMPEPHHGTPVESDQDGPAVQGYDPAFVGRLREGANPGRLLSLRRRREVRFKVCFPSLPAYWADDSAGQLPRPRDDCLPQHGARR